MILGLSFALVCALGTNLSSLFKARGAVLARPVRVRHPLRSAMDLFRQRWFASGWILALFAWGLHIEALALAPLSSVQAVLSGGLVFLAVLAERFFGFRLGRRQWAGVTLTAAGLAVIGLPATSEGPQRSSLAALIVAETAILAFGVGLVRISVRRDVEHRGESLLLAVGLACCSGSLTSRSSTSHTHTDPCSGCSAPGRSPR
jgi:drug/metabolite transporter (DMT)-like permease